MKLASTTLLLAFLAASPETRYFRYERPIEMQTQQAGQACLPIDAGVFAHAAPQLADMRLYTNDAETPYTIRVATAVAGGQRTYPVVNAGVREGQTVFDAELPFAAEMPGAHYSDVELTVTAQDFIATVTVTGSQSKSGKPATRLGEFTIFDLTRQRLGRSTVLHLPDSNFPYLHFRISGPLHPEQVTGFSAGHTPGAPPRYRTVAETSQVTQKGHATIVTFDVPANVPVDRIAFTPGTTPAAFSRDVTISAEAVQPKRANDQQSPSFAITTSGYLLRIHQAAQGKRIDEEKLTADAPRELFDTPSRWTITIANGDDSPLAIQSVRLEMLERTLCFDAAANTAYTLRYGDPALAAPQYDYARLFSSQASPLQAAAGPERTNPGWQPRPDERPFTEKYPILLWAALLGVIMLLAGIALRSAKQASRAT